MSGSGLQKQVIELSRSHMPMLEEAVGIRSFKRIKVES